ncbi:MAG TPA: M4 family metallopeptidase, partial [Anaerolineae bacterium]
MLKKSKNLATQIISACLLLIGLLLYPATSTQAADPPPDRAAAQRRLMQDAGTGPGTGLELTWDEETGVPTFIRGQFPASLSGQGQGSDLDRAYAFFNQYADLFGMRLPGDELALLRSHQTGDETHFRFQQRVQGVPVWGAQMLVHTRNGQIAALNGHYQPDITIDPNPQITADQAEAIARDELNSSQAALEEAVTLVVMTYHTEPTLTWLVKLYSEDPLGRWYYFIDAHSGQVTYHFNNLPFAKNRTVYDAQGACSTTSLPGTQIATEGTGGSLSEEQAKDAFDYMGTAYDYFFTNFGRDSFDDAGATIITSVNFGVATVCPSAAFNAFWNGSQFVFGAGGTSGGFTTTHFSNAEDVVVHEFTHAVTQYSADLIYQFQQGALNESYSDIFGVFAQQKSTGDFNDWEIGEDLGAAIRDLSDPTLGGQPAHMNDYVELGWISDSGGVHTNSGISNKAAYLMVVGGTFGGVPVSGIGLTKSEQIFYAALTNYLSPLSGFADVSDSTIQACDDLFGTFGINTGDCDQVRNAWAAVGIGLPATLPSFANRIYLPVILANAGSAGAYLYEPND